MSSQTQPNFKPNPKSIFANWKPKIAQRNSDGTQNVVSPNDAPASLQELSYQTEQSSQLSNVEPEAKSLTDLNAKMTQLQKEFGAPAKQIIAVNVPRPSNEFLGTQQPKTGQFSLQPATFQQSKFTVSQASLQPVAQVFQNNGFNQIPALQNTPQQLLSLQTAPGFVSQTVNTTNQQRQSYSVVAPAITAQPYSQLPSQQPIFATQNYQVHDNPISQQIVCQQSEASQVSIEEFQQYLKQRQLQVMKKKNQSQMYEINGIKYVVIRQLGSGGSAKVYRAMTTDGSLYALKVIEFVSNEDELQGRQAILSEIKIMQALHGRGATMELENFEVQEHKAFIVMQLGDSDLKEYMREHPFLPEYRIAALLEDMVICLQKLHDAGYIHGDLKPQNFMISKGRVKLIDFGISRQMMAGDTMVVRESLVGTPKYMAPEVISSKTGGNGKIHRVSDVWSLGVMLYEFVNGSSPFDELMMNNGKKDIFSFMIRLRDQNYAVDYRIKASECLKDLIQQCLTHDDSKRIQLSGILRHPFISPYMGK